MFINCPFCQSLVATDPATDLPPERCPRCTANLRELPTGSATPAASPLAAHDAGNDPATPVFDLLEIPTPDALADAVPPALPASGLAPRIHQAVAPEPAAAPIAPIATMLRQRAPAPEPAPEPEAEAQPASAATPAPVAPPPRATPQPPPTDATSTAAPAQGATPPAPIAEPIAPPPPAEASVAATDAPADPGEAVATASDCATETAAATPAPDTGTVADAPAAADADADASDPDDEVPETAATPEPPTPAAAAPARAPVTRPAAARALPSFARRRRRLASGFGWKPGAAIAGLALLLLLQLLLADRARLAGDARWRPLLANVCGVLGCSLPPWREPDAFSVLARDVRPHPATPGALRVTATFRNDARWPQPWPRIRLTLSDVDGKAVAARDFEANDYLGEAAAQAELRSGQSASIAMDVLEPAARSVAFDFELH